MGIEKTDQTCVKCGEFLFIIGFPHYSERWCDNKNCLIYSCLVSNMKLISAYKQK